MTSIRMRAHTVPLLCALATAVLLGVLLPAYARAELLQTTALKVYPELSASADRFGAAVARDGNTVVVGAPQGDGGGKYDTGTATVYVPNSTMPVLLSRQKTLLAPDGKLNDLFGRSVAISGDTVVVGAPWSDLPANNAGVAHVYVRSGTTWALQKTLQAPDASAESFFGWSVGIDGNTIVIGARMDPAGGSGRGKAYVFVRSGTTWSEQARLTPSDAANGDQFGTSVGISGDWITIGSPESGATDKGACYIFRRSGLAWSQSAKLVDSLGTDYDRFGTAVAISGTTVVVGVPYDNAGPGAATGSASVFTRSTAGTWARQRITASDRAVGDCFGWAVDVDGDTIVIGAPYRSSRTGSAYTYTRNYAGMWSLRRKTIASDGAEQDEFGIAVAVSSNRAVFGAPGDDDKGTDAGSAYYRTVNSAPTAVADSYTTAQGVARTVAAPGVLLNDSDPDGDKITAFLVTQPTKGTLSLASGGGFTYTPAAGFAGTDSFSYKAYDDALFSTAVKVSITVPDTTKPTVLHSANYASYLTKVTIRGDDGGGLGVKQIEYKVDGMAKPPVAGTVASFELKKVGSHSISYRALDKAGNYSAWKSATVYVKRGTALSINAPSTSAYRSAKLYGYLKYYTTSGTKKIMSGKTVKVQQYKSGKWATIATVTTNSKGRWAYTAKPSSKAKYRAYYAGSNTYAPKASSGKTVLPKVSLSTPAFRKTTSGSSVSAVKYGTTYVVNGNLKPRHTAGSTQVKIKAYRYQGGKWVYKRTYSTKASNYSSYSRYTAKIKLPSRGTWRVRAYHAADTTNAKTYSSYRTVSVK